MRMSPPWPCSGVMRDRLGLTPPWPCSCVICDGLGLSLSRPCSCVICDGMCRSPLWPCSGVICAVMCCVVLSPIMMLKIGDEYARAIVEALPDTLLGARHISHIHTHHVTHTHTHVTQNGSSWPRRRVVVTTPVGIRVPALLQHLTAHITRLIASYISHTAAISRDQARRCCCRPPSPDCDGAPSVLAARHSNLLSWHNILQDWHDPKLLPSSL